MEMFDEQPFILNDNGKSWERALTEKLRTSKHRVIELRVSLLETRFVHVFFSLDRVGWHKPIFN